MATWAEMWARQLRAQQRQRPRRSRVRQGATLPAALLPDPTPESDIQAACVALLRLRGFRVWQTSQPQIALMTPGLSDLLALHPAYGLVCIEVKSATGQQRPSQRTFAAACAWAGVVYLVTHSAAELAAQLDTLARRDGAPGEAE